MKHLRLKNIFMLTVTIFAILILLGIFRTGYNLTHIKLTTKPTILIFQKGKSASSLIKHIRKLAPQLSYAGLKFYIKFFNLGNQLKAGIYEVKADQTAIDLLDDITQGNVLKLSFRITEGTTWFDVLQNLASAEYLRGKNLKWQPTWCPVENCLHPEGLVLADTYFYEAGSDAKALLSRANLALQNLLDLIWQERNQTLPYKSPYELLIAASIIEKETAVPDERGLIAGVIVNRLKRHMPLQMDPTVIYAHRIKNQGELLARPLLHADLSVDSLYNTYKYQGLPPTPIAIPSRAALLAAAHPAETNYLYYVARPDGTHKFSVDYQGQRRAINANH